MRHILLLTSAALLLPVAALADPVGPEANGPAAAGTPAPPTMPPAAPPQAPPQPFDPVPVDHLYIGGGLGVVSPNLPATDYATAGNGAVSIESGYGFDGSAFIGYDLGAFRLEAELGYRRASVDDIDTKVSIPVTSQAGTSFIAAPGSLRDAGGSTSALSFMVNGLLDFGDEDGISGFVGGGVGAARVDFNNIRLFSDARATIDDGDTTFAWQVLAGLRHPIGDRFDVNLRYDFFSTGKVGLKSTGGVPIDARYRASSLQLGLDYNFGGPSPATPVSPHPGGGAPVTGLYVGLEAGLINVPDINIDIGTSGNKAGQVENDTGYDVGGMVGYDFGMFRVEAEVAYKSANIDNWRSTLRTPSFNSLGGAVFSVPGSYNYAGGTSSALSFMINGMLDFGDDDGLQGFVGGGAGGAKVHANYGLNRYGDFLDETDTTFAWQVLAGVRAPINDRIDATIRYSFFNTGKAALPDVFGTFYDFRLRTHSLTGGLTFHFGGPPR